MVDTCLSDDELVRLVDGDVAPNQAEALFDHLARCARCRRVRAAIETTLRDLRAPVIDVDVTAKVGELAVRIAAGDAPRERRHKTRPGVVVAAAVALVMGTALIGAWPRPATTGDETRWHRWAARGGPSSPSLSRDVVVSVDADGARLVAGAVVTAATTYRASYRNRLHAPVYALIFGVDAAGEVHWLYPAYERAGERPTSVALPPSPATSPQVLLPDSVLFESPASGALRIVMVLTTTAMGVSDIEARPSRELSATALRALFPRAEVRELTLELTKDKP